MSKLEERMKEYSIPDYPAAPMGKNVVIWRIRPEEKTAGGIFIPEAHKGVKSRGILLDAGLAAMDVLADNLIEIGDEVYFGQWAGRDRAIEENRQAAKVADALLECKVEDITASVDAKERRQHYRIYRDEETGEHRYVSRYEKTGPKAVKKGA